MIKYSPRQDRRSFAEKHSIILLTIIALAAAIAFNSFHERTQREDVVKNPNPSILQTVSAIRANQ
jgi:hypothetical protein